MAGAGNSTIQGYATSMSVNVGQAVTFNVKSTASACRIDIYRLGYYQGFGDRKVAANILPSVPLPQSQPNCATCSATGLIVGMKFRSDVAGTVTGVRFFKGSSNIGTHVGHLWSSTGTLLASVTFTGESASGWQQALFSTYHEPVGFYSSTRDYFNSFADGPPLHGLATGVDGANGVYR